MSDEPLLDALPLRDQDVLTSPELAGGGRFRHAFFTRGGGVSDGLYAGLNVGLGSNDDAGRVRENRARAMRHLGRTEADLATLWQVHSAEVVAVTAPFPDDARPRADALVTATPGLAIGVLTADCGPILFSDATAGVVGAAHSGWRGAVGGVIEATIAAMRKLGSRPSDIVAVLGPTITQKNYEVGAEMMAGVIGGDSEAAQFFAPGRSPNKLQFDLPGFVLARLAAAGVNGSFIGRCTYEEEDLFFSFRRATHRGEADYGRQLAAITIDP